MANVLRVPASANLAGSRAAGEEFGYSLGYPPNLIVFPMWGAFFISAGGSMTSGNSIELLNRWREGDERAARALFQNYTARLIALVRSHLSEKLSRRLDPEDVVQSAYRSFLSAREMGGTLSSGAKICGVCSSRSRCTNCITKSTATPPRNEP